MQRTHGNKNQACSCSLVSVCVEASGVHLEPERKPVMDGWMEEKAG